LVNCVHTSAHPRHTRRACATTATAKVHQVCCHSHTFPSRPAMAPHISKKLGLEATRQNFLLMCHCVYAGTGTISQDRAYLFRANYIVVERCLPTPISTPSFSILFFVPRDTILICLLTAFSVVFWCVPASRCSPVSIDIDRADHVKICAALYAQQAATGREARTS